MSELSAAIQYSYRTQSAPNKILQSKPVCQRISSTSQSLSNYRRALPVTSVKESSKQSMAEKFTNRDTVANLKQLPHACFPAKYKMFSETSLKT